MTRRFSVGDHVTWNSEAGQVSGKIIKVHLKTIDYKGYTHHASKEDPQYEIKSDKTDHIALHKGFEVAAVVVDFFFARAKAAKHHRLNHEILKRATDAA